MAGISLQKITPLADSPPLDDGGYKNAGFQEETTEIPIPTPNDYINDTRPSSTNGRLDIETLQTPVGDQEAVPTGGLRYVYVIQTSTGQFYQNHKRRMGWGLLLTLLVLYLVYFGFAMARFKEGAEGTIRLLWITCVVVFFIMMHFIWNLWLGKIVLQSNIWKWIQQHSVKISWTVAGLLFLAIMIFLIVDLIQNKQPYNLVSLSGVVIYILLFFIFSYNPSKVQWRSVIWGLALQYLFALLILRTNPGQKAFEWLGQRVVEFLEHTDKGSQFVFGANFRDHFFAFRVLPIVIFFNTVVAVLYHIGVMQWVIRKLSLVMQATMNTTAGESLNAAGNIFVGQTEAPLMVKPLLPQMTLSELHAVMTGGFATIAGAVLGAFIGMGVPANHLLSASVMSAPAALAMAKLFYPETEKSHTTAEDVQNMEKSESSSLIEAASAGASTSVVLVANIAANLIAFIAMLAFINATLTWLGVRVGLEPPGHPHLTFELICSYLLFPFAMIMGVEIKDCRKVAQLIGVKTFFNEFIAFQQLGNLITNSKTLEAYRSNGTNYTSVGDDIFIPSANITLLGGVLQDRSIIISTYALCGFANLSSIGIQLGGLGALVPSRKSDLAKVVVRAMIAGNVACFMTACIAGIIWTMTTVAAIMSADKLEEFEKHGPDFSLIQLELKQFTEVLPTVSRTTVVFSHLRPNMIPKCNKIIQIQRNIKDVAVSFFHFAKIMPFLHETINNWDDYISNFCHQNNLAYGNWFDYMKDWLSRKEDQNILFIQYEDFVADPPSMIRRLAAFLNKTLTEDQVKRIDQIVSFDSMHTNPKLDHYVPGGFDKTKGKFLRKGKVGDWQNHFSEEQNKSFDEFYQKFAEEHKLDLKFDI